MDPEIVYYWCRTGYEEINRYLREGTSISPTIQKKIDKLNAYITTFHTGYKDIVNRIGEVHQHKLTRLNNLKDYGLVEYDADKKRLKIFQIYRGAYFPYNLFEEKGFMSFTYDPFTAYKFGIMYSKASTSSKIANDHKLLYLKEDTDILETYGGRCAFLYLNEYENGINEFEILFKPGKITAEENIEKSEKDLIIQLFQKDITNTGISKDVMETMRDTGQRFENINANLFRKIIDYTEKSSGSGEINIQPQSQPQQIHSFNLQNIELQKKLKQKLEQTLVISQQQFNNTPLFQNTAFGVLWNDHNDDLMNDLINEINGKTAIQNNLINKETDTFIVYRIINDLEVQLIFKKTYIKYLWDYIQSRYYIYGYRIAIIGLNNKVKVLSFGTNDLSFNQDLVSNEILKQITIQKGGKKLPPKPPVEKKISTSGPFMTPARSQSSSMVQQPSLRQQEPIKSRSLLNLSDTLGMSFNKDLGMSLMSLDEKPFKLGGKKKQSK